MALGDRNLHLESGLRQGIHKIALTEGIRIIDRQRSDGFLSKRDGDDSENENSEKR